MSKRNWIVIAAAAVTVVAAAPSLLGEAGLGTAPRTGEPAATASARERPKLELAAPTLSVARPPRTPAPRSPADGPRAISRTEAEQAFQDALQAAALVARSVHDDDAPPPSARERGLLRRNAVLAFVDLAPHLDQRARESEHAAMRAALDRLETLQPHFDEESHGGE